MLSIYPSNDFASSDGLVSVYRLKVPFVENQATWNISATGVNWQVAGANGENDRELTSIGSVAVAHNEVLGTEKVIALDSSKIQEMINGTFSNNGFFLKTDAELNDHFYYKTSDSAQTTQRPKLVIQYTLSPYTSTPSLTPIASPSGTPSSTPTPTFTNTPSPTPTGPTNTPTNTSTPTITTTPTATQTPTFTLTPTFTPTPSIPIFSNATFTYDGDGKRVKSVLTTNLGSTTTYFVGNHYEVTNGVVTKYYYAGTQRIAMRENGVLSYIFSDHLGSTSMITDSLGNVIAQQKYKAWGEVRYSSSGNSPTNYTYTGQYSYANDLGLMYYGARWYDPSLSRFAQADSLIPASVQGLDRYAYTFNNPINFIDPSGHVPVDCLGGDGYCSGNSNNGSSSSSGNNNPLMECQIHCSRDDISDATLEERYDWFSWLRGQMNEEIPGAGNWFNNIQTVMEGFINTGQHNNEWVLSVNVDILLDIQQGFASFTEGSSVPTTYGGAAWYEFFQMASNVDNSEITNNDLLHQWGVSELLSTYDGMIVSGAGLPSQGDDIIFTLFGTGYRVTHFTVCYISSCLTDFRGVLSPLSTINSVLSSPGTSVYIAYGDRSPVAIPFYAIYYGDLR